MSRDAPFQSRPSLSVRQGRATGVHRALAEETAVALVYNGTTVAVMMATPADLEDFAVGFALTEGIVTSAEEIESVEIVPHDAGIELQCWVAAPRAEALGARRRAAAGPVGCGLCGIDSLEAALRTPSVITGDLRLSADAIDAGVTALRAGQVLHDRTRAVHAAGYWEDGALRLLREDVGRHNALDKLAGALARNGIHGTAGAVVLTSRISIELVQKTAVIGAPVLIAASAPTAHAVRLAEEAGLTLVAHARGEGFDVFTHAHRITLGAEWNVA